MKNLRPLILGIIIGALATYFFCPRQVAEEEATEEIAVEKPKGVITVEEAIALNDNWTKYRQAAVDSAISVQTEGRKKKDDRSVGWALKDVRNYLDWAEVESEKVGYTMDSIRVYLGVYGASAGEKADYTTMFIAPIVTKTSKAGMSFNLSQNNNFPPPFNDGSGGQGQYP